MYSQNTGGSYFDTQGGSAQVTTVVSSHNMVGTGAIQMGVSGGQIISSTGGTYLIGNSMENSGHSVSHTTRASPATVSSLFQLLFTKDTDVNRPLTFSLATASVRIGCRFFGMHLIANEHTFFLGNCYQMLITVELCDID